jgi:hypothetical protein
MAQKSSIDQLNSFLRGELSAVETYRLAIGKLENTSAARADLELNMQSHQERITMLRDAILLLGGTPSTSSGPWGVFAKAVEGSARVFGEKAAVSALEEGEDHGLADYKRDAGELEGEAKRIVASELLPQQRQTHDRMSALKHRLR